MYEDENGQGESTADTPVIQGSEESTNNATSDKNPLQSFVDRQTSAPVEISPMVAGVLKGVPEHLLPTLAPFVEEWDKNYQTKTQAIKDQFKDFEGLNAAEAREALEFQKLVLENPAEAIRLLSEDTSDNLSEDDEDDIIKQLPVELQERFAKLDKLEQIVQLVAQAEIDRKNSVIQEENLKEYVSTLEALEKTYGKFDRQYVNLMVSNGTEPEDAVKSFLKLANDIAAERLQEHNVAPSILGGKGDSPVTGTVDVKDLSSSERKSLVTKMLQANRE
jgi:hypothetical protein